MSLHQIPERMLPVFKQAAGRIEMTAMMMMMMEMGKMSQVRSLVTHFKARQIQ